MRRSLATAALLVASCGRPVSGADGPTPPRFTCPIPSVPAAPTFAADVFPMLQATCGAAATSCHGGAAPRGHVSFAADAGRTAADVRAALVNVPPASAPPGWMLVAPGDVARSWVVEKVTRDEPGGVPGASYGARMPYAAPNLCPETVQAIELWIVRGAI